jgi:hypothetical protein
MTGSWYPWRHPEIICSVLKLAEIVVLLFWSLLRPYAKGMIFYMRVPPDPMSDL